MHRVRSAKEKWYFTAVNGITSTADIVYHSTICINLMTLTKKKTVFLMKSMMCSLSEQVMLMKRPDISVNMRKNGISS